MSSFWSRHCQAGLVFTHKQESIKRNVDLVTYKESNELLEFFNWKKDLSSKVPIRSIEGVQLIWLSCCTTVSAPCPRACAAWRRARKLLCMSWLLSLYNSPMLTCSTLIFVLPGEAHLLSSILLQTPSRRMNCQWTHSVHPKQRLEETLYLR